MGKAKKYSARTNDCSIGFPPLKKMTDSTVETAAVAMSNVSKLMMIIMMTMHLYSNKIYGCIFQSALKLKVKKDHHIKSCKQQ